MNSQEVLIMANASKSRSEAISEMSRLLESAFTMELKINREMTVRDEDLMGEMRTGMDRATTMIGEKK